MRQNMPRKRERSPPPLQDSRVWNNLKRPPLFAVISIVTMESADLCLDATNDTSLTAVPFLLQWLVSEFQCPVCLDLLYRPTTCRNNHCWKQFTSKQWEHDYGSAVLGIFWSSIIPSMWCYITRIILYCHSVPMVTTLMGQVWSIGWFQYLYNNSSFDTNGTTYVYCSLFRRKSKRNRTDEFAMDPLIRL